MAPTEPAPALEMERILGTKMAASYKVIARILPSINTAYTSIAPLSFVFKLFIRLLIFKFALDISRRDRGLEIKSDYLFSALVPHGSKNGHPRLLIIGSSRPCHAEV